MADSYREIADRAQQDPAYREGLSDAARVARAQYGEGPPCPPEVIAVYLGRLADGELP